MEKIVMAKPNQSMLDLILMGYGTLEASMHVMAANNQSISAIPDAGSSWIMPSVPDSALDTDAAAYLKQHKIEIGTLSS